MKCNSRCILSILTILLTALTAKAAVNNTFYYDGKAYAITSANDRTVSLTNYYYTGINGTITNYYNVVYTGNIVIPSVAMDGSIAYTVTGIATDAFKYGSGVTSITIPATVTSISNNAFPDKMSALNDMILEDGDAALSINNNQTINRGSIKNWYIGRNITKEGYTIDDSANDNFWFTFFENAESIVVGDNVTKLYNRQFYNCKKLKTVELGSGLSAIPSELFQGAENLESVNIPNGVTIIEQGAFGGCDKLSEISIPSSVLTVKPAFSKNASDAIFTKFTIEDSDTPITFEWSGYSAICPIQTLYIGRNVNNTSSTTSPFSKAVNVTFGNHVTAISNKLLYKSTVETVTFSNHIETIGEYAFYESNKLKVLELPESVKEIQKNAFRNCDMLETITLNEGLETIGENAFYSCDLLKSIVIPASVSNIGSSAFSYVSLQKVEVSWVTPIVIASNVFSSSTYSNATLLVPGGTVKKYQATATWNKFANIVPTAIGVNMTATAGGSIRLGDDVVSNGTKLLQVEPNSVLTFLITPENTHYLESVTVNGEDMTAQVANGQLTPSDLSEDLEIVATFTAKPFYTVTATALGGGTATVGDASVMWGNGTIVTLIPNEGHELKSVTVNNVNKTSEVSDGVLTLNDIRENKNIVANFQIKTFSISETHNTGGNVQLSSNSAQWGSNVTVTISPDDDHILAKCDVNGIDVTDNVTDGQYTITVKESTVVDVTFTAKPYYYSVTATVSGGGTAVVGSTSVMRGHSTTVTLTPDEGYVLKSVTVNNIDKTSEVVEGVLALDNIQENKNVVAAFDVITASITLAKATGGTYCPTMDLDFSGVTGLKAYIAVGFNPDEGVVWIMRVDYVPANEGIMIKGTPGTYDIPYHKTGFHYNNMLVGSHVKRTLPVEENGYYNYVLKDGLFCPSNGSASVGVNKAYLRIPTSWVDSSPSAVRELTMEEVADPTGIVNNPNNMQFDVHYYNLNGQRIEHLKKGLFIKNGKKIMVR